MDSYTHIILKEVPSDLEDILTYLCFEFGASGVSQNLEFSQFDSHYNVKTLDTEFICLDVFFDKEPSEDFINKLRQDYPQILVKIETCANQDWLKKWKEGYTAFSLCNDYWVVPSWEKEDFKNKNLVPIFIDPGMAFGTGTHATTQIAAELLYSFKNELAQKEVIDVGTGTGILAILADKLGAQSVVANEIDEPARQVAKENCTINNTKNVLVVDYLVDKENQVFDVVIANIIDGVLLNLKQDLFRIGKSKACYILTGILAERDEKFYTEFIKNLGLTVKKKIAKEEWIGYLAEKS